MGNNRRSYAVMEPHYETFYKGLVCYYCMEPADTMDHVPPISLTYARGAEYFERKNIKLVKVSCCRECNSLLGAVDKLTVERRARYIYDKLLKRYKRLLASPKWYEDELGELGPNLASYIEKWDTYKIWIERRLEQMEDIHGDVI